MATATTSTDSWPAPITATGERDHVPRLLRSSVGAGWDFRNGARTKALAFDSNSAAVPRTSQRQPRPAGAPQLPRQRHERPNQPNILIR